MQVTQAIYPEARSLKEAEIVLAQKPTVKLEPVSGDWMRPVINLPKSGTQFGVDCSDINSIQAETIGMGLDRNDKAQDANIRASSMYKSSGDSSLIQVSEAFQAPVCMDTFLPVQSAGKSPFSALFLKRNQVSKKTDTILYNTKTCLASAKEILCSSQSRFCS